MNKQELTDAVAERAGISKTAAAQTIDAVIDTVSKAVASGDSVQLIVALTLLALAETFPSLTTGVVFAVVLVGVGVLVVGVDGTPTSLRAAAYAAGLARRQRSRLIIVYARKQPAAFWPSRWSRIAIIRCTHARSATGLPCAPPTCPVSCS